MKTVTCFLMILSGCTLDSGPMTPLRECKSHCGNPYAGFAGSNVGLYTVGVVQESECEDKCAVKFPAIASRKDIPRGEK